MGARPGAARSRIDAAGEGEDETRGRGPRRRDRLDRAVRKLEAKRNAGDPGRVLARRLSNAEYDYTIRDLTGVDLRPTREFPSTPPTRPASTTRRNRWRCRRPWSRSTWRRRGGRRPPRPQARRVRLRAAPVVADTDRDKYCVDAIIDFYKRQRTDYADYFLAAWRFQHRDALGQPGALRSTAFADELGLSRKYLATIWSMLDDSRRGGRPDRRAAGAVERTCPRPEGRRAGRRAGRLRADARLRRRAAARLVPEVKNLTAPGHQQRLAAVRALEEPPVRREPDAVRRAERRRSGSTSCDLARRPPGHWPSPTTPTTPATYEAGVRPVLPDVPRRVLRLGAGPGLPRPEEGEGERRAAAERRLPQHDGLLPRRRPALRADARRAGPARARPALARVRFHHRRPDAAVLELPLVRARRDRFMRGDAAFDFARAEDKDAASEAKIERLAEVYLAKARRHRGERPGDPGDRGPVPRSSRRDIRRVEQDRLRGRAEPRRGPPGVRRAGLPPAALERRARRRRRVLSDAPRAGRAEPRGRRPRHGRQRPDVAPLLLPRRPARRRARASGRCRITPWPAA